MTNVLISALKKSIPALVTGGVFLVVFSCTEPLPIYGRWADNRGDVISFVEDGTFLAAIVYPAGAKVMYEGTWSILRNSLTLNGTSGDISVQIVTEWDIRGNMLYFDWATDERAMALTLYKISN
jgi:hypothetical protein